MNNNCVSLEVFKDLYLPNDYDENMFLSNGSINPKYNSFKNTGVIAQIFEDHWDAVYSNNFDIINEYRPNADKEIKKVIDCYNKNLGCSIYQCPDCHDFIFIGHTCKSRLCSSCGYKYKNDRVESILQSAYNCNHRQLVFTIPKELRKYLFSPFDKAIDILFASVRDTIYSIINESFKYSKFKKKLIKYVNKILYSPGFFAFLHTFGRDLKWNPHIHVLLAEIKIDKFGNIKKWDYFNFDALSKRFQKILLDNLYNFFGSSFSSTRHDLFNKYKNGFYVYAEKKEFKSFKDGVEYVTRYCGRAPISENRIINYDGFYVTFSYNDHYDDSYHEVTVSAEEFILMIVRHIIPDNYKIIRYYGFYRKKPIIHDKIVMLIDKCKHNIRRQFLKHQFSILINFKRDPYHCPRCDAKLNYLCEVT